MKKLDHYVNHIGFVVDRSGSMSSLKTETVTIFDNQIKHLAERSKDLNQETRASIYMFDSQVDNIVFDIDVLRLPSMKGFYEIGGQTALIDATLKAIEDMSATPQLYGDHAFLLYVLTDGEENASSATSTKLRGVLSKLPDNWTVAVLVPTQSGIRVAEQYGFPRDNIAVWTTSKEGVKEVGKVIAASTDSFMKARSVGVRSTKNLFTLNDSNLSTTTVARNLTELSPATYEVLHVRKYDDGKAIKDFVESWTKLPYRVGSAYYQLSKPEKVQPAKNIIIVKNSNGKAYSGVEARDLLGLPDYEVKVAPASHIDWTIFIQSTSVNRKIVQGTQLIVMK